MTSACALGTNNFEKDRDTFLGSYALHTDPIVRGNLVSVSVCHFEDEKTRDTKTSGR